MKRTLIIAMACALLAPAGLAAQTKGLFSKEITVAEGTIIIYLPDDMRTGDLISGTIDAVPNGTKKKEKAANTEGLKKYAVQIGAITLTVAGNSGQHFDIDEVPLNPSLIVKDNNDGIIYSSPMIPVATVQQPLPVIPTHALTSSPLRIAGPFDGSAVNTRCRLDGKEVNILAESPRQCIVFFPQTTSGIHTLAVSENGKTREQKISAVNLQLSADKTNLRRGESTTLKVVITGLENLPANATLNITNASTSTINLSGGNTQAITISPAQTGSNGVFTQNLMVQSINTGGFSVSAGLLLPEAVPPFPPSSTRAPCVIGNQAVMLTAAECATAKRNMTATTGAPVPTTSLNNYWSVQKIQRSGNQLLIGLSGPFDIEAEALLFSYSEPGSVYNAPLAATGHTNNTYTVDAGRLPLTGVYHIQAAALYENDITLSRQAVLYNAVFYHPEIRSHRADSIRSEITRLQNEIERLENEKKTAQAQQAASGAQAEQLRKERDALLLLYSQLEAIDVNLSNAWLVWGNELYKLVDSLEQMRNHAGALPDEDLLKERARNAGYALEGCGNAQDNLEKEKKDLEKKIEDTEAQYQNTLNQVQQLIQSKHPYLKFTSKTYKTKSGKMGHTWGLYLLSAGGGETPVNYTPADIPDIANEYNALNAQLNTLVKQNLAAKQQLAQLPALQQKLKEECEKKRLALEAAQKDEREGIAKIRKDEYLGRDIADLCGRIQTAMYELVEWCEKNPGRCSAGIEEQCRRLTLDCPKTTAGFEQYRNFFNSMVAVKQAIENSYKSSAEAIDRQLADAKSAVENSQQAIDGLQQQINDAAGGLAYAKAAEERAVNQEIYRREQEKAMQNKAERERREEMKRVCMEWLNTQMKTEAGQQWLKTMINIKEELLAAGEEVEAAAKMLRMLPKNRRTAMLRNMAKKFSARLNSLLEPLAAFRELEEKVEALKQRMEQALTFMNGEENPEANAKKFGEVLNLLNEALSEIGNKFPLLQFFTAYFDFLVQGYQAAIQGIYDAFSGPHDRIAQSSLDQGITCDGLIELYRYNRNMNELTDLLFHRLKLSLAAPRSNEEQRILKQALQKAILKKLTDCCLSWAIIPA